MDKEFVDGMIVKKPRDNAPDFIKANISLKLAEFKPWITKIEGKNAGKEWINIQVLESKNGKWYAELDTWEPKKEFPEPVADDIPWG